jgi:hypothetical protein
MHYNYSLQVVIGNLQDRQHESLEVFRNPLQSIAVTDFSSNAAHEYCYWSLAIL